MAGRRPALPLLPLPPPPLPPLLLLLLLLLLDAPLGYGLRAGNEGDIIVNWRVQDPTTCHFPDLDQTTLRVGTSIRMTCDSGCTLEEFQKSNSAVAVIGTEVYRTDSDLCLAAIHDRRAAHPSRWSGGADLVLRVVRLAADADFAGTFSGGVRSSYGAGSDLGLVFVSDKVVEPVADVTTVHSKFRFRENEFTQVECHTGDPDDIADIRFWKPDGRQEYLLLGERNYTEDSGRGNFKNSSWFSKGGSPKSLVCRLEDQLYSDTTTTQFLVNSYYEPTKFSNRASVGDNITISIGSSGSTRDQTWLKDGLRLTDVGRALEIRNVKVSDGGLYLALKGGDNFGASSTRLIVRGCPAGLLGSRCDRKCPYCLHGGQCHAVTGECVCPPGFNGTRCQTSCEEARFGQKCSSTCPDSTCRGRLLCVPDPYGCTCAAGWTGQTCSEVCSLGTYGPDCAFPCGDCAGRGNCNRFTGACTDGCKNNNSVLPPLCLGELSPWFRDPPTLAEAGYTSLAVSHPAWNSSYDNGFGSGRYRYIVNYRRSGDTGWTTPLPRHSLDGSRLAGQDVKFAVYGLKAESQYWIRIVIRDLTKKVSMSNESRVPVLSATTDCAAPGGFEGFDVQDITANSSTLAVQPLQNEKSACAYTLEVLILAVKPRGAQQSFTIDKKSETKNIALGKLKPYTIYNVSVNAKNRKGSGIPAYVTFNTSEAAPTSVLNLVGTQTSALQFNVTWSPPHSPNGRIRRYEVTIYHIAYRACSRGLSDVEDRRFQATATTSLNVTLNHPFSVYSVSVVAVTIASGPQASATLNTGALPPSSEVRSPTAQPTVSGFIIAWNSPDCTTWNDELRNLRVLLKIRGISPWAEDLPARNISSPEHTITGLIPYSEYSLQLYLGNTAGIGTEPVTVNQTTRQHVPGPVKRLTVLVSLATSVTIGWNPPVPPRSRITSYRVTYSRQGTGIQRRTYLEHDICLPGKYGLRCQTTISRLDQNVNYIFVVSAYSSDTDRHGQPETVNGTTREGKPGKPRSVGILSRTMTMLNISWRSPFQRNGVILGFQLNISYPATAYETNSQVPTYFSSVNVMNDRDLTDETPHFHVQRGLRAGRRYLVRIAARTSAGFGAAHAARLETQVAPPRVRRPPSIPSGSVTDTTVTVTLPRVDGAGAAEYYGVVSTDLAFDGVAITADNLPDVDEAQRRNLNYYVAAVLSKDEVARNPTFVFGDGKYYNGSGRHFYNRPLRTGVTYQLGTAVVSRLSDDNVGVTFQRYPQLVTVRAPDGTGLIVGILFAVLVLLVAAVLGAVMYRRRRDHDQKLAAQEQLSAPAGLLLRPMAPQTPIVEEQYMDLTVDGQVEDIYQNLQAAQINYTRILVSDLVETLHRSEANGQLKAQIGSLPSGLARPCQYGRQPANSHKNRYGNLIAYDDTRVVLEKLPGDRFSDYINASYVDGYQRPAAYIATQGPKPETVADFWRMVWQTRAERIVMLTNLVEGNTRKCDLYWPEQAALQLPGMSVRSDAVQVANDFTVRTFSVVAGQEQRKVTQLHYTAWPDHSVPMHPSSLAKFMRALDNVPDGGAPTVVHCSAGVGRTGTVILIDAMYQMGRSEQAVDVYSQLAVVRQQRANLCANSAQYRLVHQVLVQLLVAPDTAVPAGQLTARLAQMRSVAAGPSQLEQQLTYLHTNPPPVSFATALGENLDGKNRSPEILPEDNSRVYLHGTASDNYINAVYVAGFKKADAFIATEAPLPSRRSLFWQMVDQKSVRTIVVINDLASQDVFWPSPEESIVYGNIRVEAKKLKPLLPVSKVEVLELTMKTTKKDETVVARDLLVFLLSVDTAPGAEPAPGDVVQLYTTYERSLPNGAGGPTVVVCRTGVTWCGLFLASCFVLSRMAEEQEVDVVMAVSYIRKSRPQFVATMKQFELCYDVAVAWLGAFDIYANFQ